MEMIMADSAQSAVDSLLGRLSSMLVDEVRLLSGVHGDVQFIKDEMESMNGFLLDVAAAGPGRAAADNQVRAWKKQVQEVAYDSQNCLDRYVQAFGATRHSPGLLASLTRPARHRVATQIRELKARVRDVGERRHRYGITAPPRAPSAGSVVTGGDGAAGEAAARRLRALALADADHLLDIDASAAEVVSWLLGEQEQPASRDSGGHRRPHFHALSDAWNNFILATTAASKYSTMTVEMIKLARGLAGDNDTQSQSIGEVASVVLDTQLEIIIGVLKSKGKKAARVIDEKVKEKAEALSQELGWLGGWLKNLVAGGDHQGSKKTRGTRSQGQPPPPPPPGGGGSSTLGEEYNFLEEDDVDDGDGGEEKASEELLRYMEDLYKRLIVQVFLSDQPRAKLLAMVTPPVNARDPAVEQPRAHEGATELARRVYGHPRAASHFACKVWVDAGRHRQRKQRLESILQQLSPGQDHQGWDEKRLEEKILELVSGKRRFLIVLADHEDLTPWEDIANAFPLAGRSDSAIIVIPRIQRTVEVHAWYVASWFSMTSKSRSQHRVHFYPYIYHVGKKAAELLTGSERFKDSRGTVYKIVKKCCWDSFSQKLFLHALHDNPHRSKEDLDRLLPVLTDFNTARNAREIFKFYYDGLPSHYRTCLLNLSIFPQGSKIRKTSLRRRWAAEMIIKRDGLTSAVDEAGGCFNALVASGVLIPDHGHGSSIGPSGKVVRRYTVHQQALSSITKMASDENAGNQGLPPVLAHRVSSRTGVQMLPQGLLEMQRKPWLTCCREQIADQDHHPLHLLSLLLASGKLGSVQVLDLEDCKGLTKRKLKNICNNLCLLVYLSLRNTDAAELPKEIDKLRYLETLDVRQTKVHSLPARITALPKLLHLLAGGHVGSDESFSTLHMPRGIEEMPSMQTLSHVEVSGQISTDDDKELAAVGRLEQLRKLGVAIHANEAHLLKILLRVVGNLHGSLLSLSIRIETVKDGGVLRSKRPGDDGVAGPDDLNTYADSTAFSPPKALSSFSITGWINGLPTWIRELHRLSKITLCDTNLKDSDVRILGKLVGLRCVRLRRRAYSHRDHKLTLKTKEFRSLELLVVDSSDITHIHFEKDTASKLSKIVWRLPEKPSLPGASLSGVETLQSLREVELTGNFHVTSIKEAMEANPNHPILVQKQDDTPEKAVAAASRSA